MLFFPYFALFFLFRVIFLQFSLLSLALPLEKILCFLMAVTSKSQILTFIISKGFAIGY